nr:hypothetical protein CFP56_24468 [Quercus suber]
MEMTLVVLDDDDGGDRWVGQVWIVYAPCLAFELLELGCSGFIYSRIVGEVPRLPAWRRIFLLTHSRHERTRPPPCPHVSINLDPGG